MKATATKRFQYLGEKDKNAHYLLWLDFGHSFVKNEFSSLRLFKVKFNADCSNLHPDLWKYLKDKDGKCNLGKFINATNGNYEKWKIDLTDSNFDTQVDNTNCSVCKKDLWVHIKWTKDGLGFHSKKELNSL